MKSKKLSYLSTTACFLGGKTSATARGDKPGGCCATAPAASIQAPGLTPMPRSRMTPADRHSKSLPRATTHLKSTVSHPSARNKHLKSRQITRKSSPIDCTLGGHRVSPHFVRKHQHFSCILRLCEFKTATLFTFLSMKCFGRELNNCIILLNYFKG